MEQGGVDEKTKRPWRWPVSRLVLAAELYGRGWDFDEIARHPGIRSTAYSVRRALRRAGLELDDMRRGRTVRLPIRHPDLPPLEAAAQARGIGVAELLERVVGFLASDPSLVRAVLDDDAA